MATWRIGDHVTVNDRMQRNYTYRIEAPSGRCFDPGFRPFASPKRLLALGVFEGRYLSDCRGEFPRSWFDTARLADPPDPTINCFGVKSRQSLAHWREKGWIMGPDPRGWFQWFCRYWQGRRLERIDQAQIRRWRAFARHSAQIRANCQPHDLACRPRQRQALLQWSHDPFI
ncbi:MAG: hypothetical protein RIE31_03650 [Alphaproteobacteria bacterium]